MTTLTEEISRWVSELRYEQLPPEVVTKAKRLLLDTLGCCLGALEATPVRLARQVVRQQGGNPQATPVGFPWKTSCEQAAFLNGMAVRYLDFNDYAVSGNHPSINVAPALSLAETQALGGKDLLLGITVGYEVQLRLRDATRGRGEEWDGSTMTHYSAAALAGKLLGLPPSELAQALAIAGSHASTLPEVRRGKLSMWKGAADPMGVRAGTFAALLARAGLTGPLTILEGKCGYGKMVGVPLETGLLLRKSSEDFEILKSCIKVWPCLFVAQAPIAAALEIHGKGIAPERIKKITVFLSDFGYKQQKRFLKTGISTREDADHSVPYCVARALLDGKVWLDHFEEENFKDPLALELIGKVSLRRDLNLPEKVGAKVEVRLKDGNIVGAEFPYPPGHVQNPLGEGGILKKFHALSERVLGQERARKASEIVLHVEELSNVGVLTAALCASKELD